MSSTPSLLEFIARWQASTLSERSAAQTHFIELCQILGQPIPAAADPLGAFYTFEKGVQKTSGGQGFADVWLRGHFAWEYKGKHRNLVDAYQQLLKYREDLENPPLLVVCDLNRFEVHTNFTGTAKRVYAFTLADLAKPDSLPSTTLSALEVLRCLFTDPEKLRPQQTTSQVTEKAASNFALLAESLRRYGAEPEQAAHFLMRLLFCLFAEDVDLLPNRMFNRLVEATRNRPAEFARRLSDLFAAMSTGGYFGADDIAYFNGGLFADSRVLDFASDDMEVLTEACKLDWASVEPSIFGTLFERGLDPSKRSQLGAHYTSKGDILLIVEPVLMAPLRREWTEVRQHAHELIAKRDATTRSQPRTLHQNSLQKLLVGFSSRIASVRVLDPACGSGNFLYVALKQLLDLEKEVITFTATNGLSAFFPQVAPEQLYGIEVNPYAHELAQVVVWIGYIQWLRDNGFGLSYSPLLRPLHNIKRMDAILTFDEQGKPHEPEWPAADVIIGNPPFLGGKRLRDVLGDEYVEQLFSLYDDQVSREADLVCYWFERARAHIVDGRASRAGLLATNSIRGGANRRVLQQIKESGDIFMAWSDRPWVLDGAAVRVSMVGLDDGQEGTRTLNGMVVAAINSDLSSTLDLTQVPRLAENIGIAFQGPVKVGPFDIGESVAMQMLRQPNPNGLSNTQVIKPLMNASDITRRSRNMWIIDFGELTLGDASLFEAPFEYVKRNVKPLREKNNDRQRRTFWWRLGRSGGDLKKAKEGKSRVIVTPRVAKHRVFVWTSVDLVPDSRLFAFARDDDYFFGILHSHVHEIWSLHTCSWHGVGNDPTYNTTTCFETFPFPCPPGQEPAGDPRVDAIAEAARELVEKRDRWLNPEGASEAELKKRTLTNLYNKRPTWLILAHGKLDAAVLDGYGWPHNLTDEELLARLLALNLERVSAQTEVAGPSNDEDD